MKTINNRLKVYSASAGSGKTFTLALEYIKLLILNPDNYKYILAVTFTNKATDEMKKRILSKLYGLAFSLQSSDDYLSLLLKVFPQQSEKDIRERAHLALNNLLDHYNWFRVETIDSFFQSVMRSLARELGLTANLSVGLNDKEVEEQAVDNVIDSISSKNDPVLTWIMEYINQQMASNKSWNVIGKFKSFSQMLSKEYYQKHADSLQEFQSNDAKAKEYRDQLYAIVKSYEGKMEGYSKKFFDLTENNGLDSKDFYQSNKGVWGLFTKLGNGANAWADVNIFNSYVTKCMDEPDKLLKGTANPASGRENVINEIINLLEQVQEEHAQATLMANTALLTLGNLNELKLLARIGQEVDRINNETNSYLLSSTQSLLSQLIDDSDSPFIYEKIGGELRYIMIDEFQDTSNNQWDNFKVLLLECLSHDKGSLIVGDVKQSIYRWRSGDWRILNRLTNDTVKAEKITLDTNYRSDYYVVKFNNAFFHTAAELTKDQTESELKGIGADQKLLDLNAKIVNVYADTEQKVKKANLDHRKGGVKVELIDDDDMDLAMKEAVRKTVAELLEKGAREKDIAVIVRKNQDIKDLAEYFQQNDIEVNGQKLQVNMVSEEAFRLDSSLSVCTMINAMRLLVNPKDDLTKAALLKAYQQTTPQATDLPEEFTTDNGQLISLSLMDLADRLFRLFNLDHVQGESSYVCTFFDEISKFVHDHVPDLSDFLTEWDDKLCGKSITNDNVDGIRMLTIHKSKGLEFPNVIVPYCDWEIEKSDDLIWVQPQRAPFNKLPIVPVKLSGNKLLQSFYREDYLNEHIMNLIDNLNLLYVAFTRARTNLFVFGKLSKPRYPSLVIKSTLDKLAENKELEIVEQTEDKNIIYSLGDVYVEPADDNRANETNDKKEEINVFEPEEKNVGIQLRPRMSLPEFKQSNASSEFILSDEDVAEKERLQYIKTGNLIHSILANTRYAEDLPKVVAEMDYDGYLYNKEVSREGLLDFLRKRLTNPQVASWFSHKWQVINERTILTLESDNEVRAPRPDRVIVDEANNAVVIDFKTGAPRPAHQQQVSHYMDLLGQMGYASVKGFLWYILPNKIEVVK